MNEAVIKAIVEENVMSEDDLQTMAVRMARSLALIAGHCRAGSKHDPKTFSPMLDEARIGIGDYCWQVQHPVACDLFEVERARMFVCRTCETAWLLHEDDTWSSADWSALTSHQQANDD